MPALATDVWMTPWNRASADMLKAYLVGISTLIARLMRPTRGPSGAERTQVGPMLAPWTLLSGNYFARLKFYYTKLSTISSIQNSNITYNQFDCYVEIDNFQASVCRLKSRDRDQSGRSPKVVALFSATYFSSNFIELLQLHDTIEIKWSYLMI